MASYFDPGRSARSAFGQSIPETVRAIADRYIRANPEVDPRYRVHRVHDFQRTWDGRYRFDFPRGSGDGAPRAAVAHSALHRDAAGTIPLAVEASCEFAVYVNGQPVCAATPEKQIFEVSLDRGWNIVTLVFRETQAGFSGIFGVVSPYRELHFLAPSRERAGESGWMWTLTTSDPRNLFRSFAFAENDDPVLWNPPRDWEPERRALGRFGRLYGCILGARAFARSTFILDEDGEVEFDIAHDGDFVLRLDGSVVAEGSGSGRLKVVRSIAAGSHDLRVESRCVSGRWDFSLDAFSLDSGREPIPLRAPVPVSGRDPGWFYLGPFAENDSNPDLGDFSRPFPGVEGPVYWRTGDRDATLRPTLEAPLFGQWNYPLGVTLYGLLSAGRVFIEDRYIDYVSDHVNQATLFYELAVWEFGKYGATGLNRQLASIDILDNCGSFASLMLELSSSRTVRNRDIIAERVAHFMRDEHERLPNGALYRARHHVPVVVGTLWADDLYMSVPFLIRYATIYERRDYLDFAITQILAFARLLLIPELNILSHVYDTKVGAATGVPWGRGNGWFFFSLAELLSTVADGHETRSELLALFEKTAAAYLTLRDERGLWHQVLTDPTSYAETSCTAMFAYAFARGVRRGWLPAAPYADAARVAWRGMAETAIDAEGNIYGVCKGSSFSTSASYYRDELGWLLNDTHGTGILLLAGAEVHLLNEDFKERDS